MDSTSSSSSSSPSSSEDDDDRSGRSDSEEARGLVAGCALLAGEGDGFLFGIRRIFGGVGDDDEARGLGVGLGGGEASDVDDWVAMVAWRGVISVVVCFW